MKADLRKYLRRPYIGPIIVYSLLLAALLAAVLGYRALSGLLLSQQAAERWRGESEDRFAQISVFLPVDATASEADIANFRQELDKALLDASLEAPAGGSLWADAYSAAAKVSLSGDKGATTATAIGVGGDFFLFHPLQLRSGSYLRGDDLNQDRAVIDEELAWKLFGAVEVAGMSFTISGQPYYVAGVVAREDDFASRRAYGETGAGLFLSYAALNSLSESGITCYELVAADPITGFALDVAEEKFPVTAGEALENSSRYRLLTLARLVLDFGDRSLVQGGRDYPYWENAARLTEDYAALLLVAALLAALWPLTGLLRLTVRLFRRWQRQLQARIKARRGRP